MVTIKDRYYLINIAYGPQGVSTEFYSEVLSFYEVWVNAENMTPSIDAIEDHMFNRAMDELGLSLDDKSLGMSRDAWIEMRQQNVDAYGKDVRRDIKKCLRHAGLCFFDFEFYTVEGNSPVIRNGPQRKLFKIYDIYGNSD